MEYTESAKNILNLAIIQAKNLGHSYVGTEHILLAFTIDKTTPASKVLLTNGIEELTIRKMIDQYVESNTNVAIEGNNGYSPSAKRILKNAENEAIANNADKIGTEHILIAILKDKDCIAIGILNTIKGSNVRKIYLDLVNMVGINDSAVPSRKYDPLSKTPMIDQYSKDLTDYARRDILDPVIGREEEILRTIQILSRRTKNNPCLIGEPGVGKTAVAEGIANLIVKNQVPDTILNKRLVSLDLGSMVAGTQYRGMFEERIKKVIDELKENKNIILFIDEIHTVIGAGGAEGSLDAANILKPALARGEIQVIGATTLKEYRKYIEKDAALERRFQTVLVEEPSAEKTIEILKGLRPRYEKFHNLIITDEAIEAAVKLSERYIVDRIMPDKAIDLIDEACSKIRISTHNDTDILKQYEDKLADYNSQKEQLLIEDKLDEIKELKEKEALVKYEYEKEKSKLAEYKKTHNNKVEADDIAAVVSLWTKVPVSKLTEDENEKLKNLEKILHEKVIGQDEAIEKVSKALRRNRLGIKDPNKPIGTFLFLGPTGVGKTELSKAIADTMFGTKNSLIRVDMSEFMEKFTVSKLIGSPPGYVGYEEGGQLTDKIRTNPYSVVLFDEIEKANEDIFNVLLQVLDEGHMTDGQGRKVSFKNSIIIMTSNVGANRIIDNNSLGFETEKKTEEVEHEEMKNNVMDEVKKLFKPEFINRIDDIIVFHKLTRDEISEIMDLQLYEISKRIKDNLNITIHLTDKAKDYILDKGYKDEFGARELKRTLTSNVEDLIAENKINGVINNGDDITINSKNNKLEIKVSK